MTILVQFLPHSQLSPLRWSYNCTVYSLVQTSWPTPAFTLWGEEIRTCTMYQGIFCTECGSVLCTLQSVSHHPHSALCNPYFVSSTLCAVQSMLCLIHTFRSRILTLTMYSNTDGLCKCSHSYLRVIKNMIVCWFCFIEL